MALSRRVLIKGLPRREREAGMARRMFLYTLSSIVDNFSPLV